jgi:hypothetical protein
VFCKLLQWDWHLQPLPAECCWWKNCASYGTGFWLLAISTHGLMKPCSLQETQLQQQFSINVWAGIICDILLGSYELPPGLSRPLIYSFYLNKLQLWDDIKLSMPQTLWVLHNGAPAHSSHNVMQYLGSHYPRHWIWWNEPVVWPPW